MLRRGQATPRVAPDLTWRADLFALVGYLAEAEATGDAALTGRRLRLLVRHWRRRPPSPPRRRRGG